MTRLDWGPIIDRAREIVDAEGVGVTLRYVFYRLVAEGLIENRSSPYRYLSKKTAEARRNGTFPDLIDETREIREAGGYMSPGDALQRLTHDYRRDRTEGQRYAVYLGIEKRAQVSALWSWFGAYGVPIFAVGGLTSQTFCDTVSRHVRKEDRETVLLYAGDFDATGVFIPDDFTDRAGNPFDHVRVVALTESQVLEYDLPPQLGKAEDSRASAFIEEYGRLIQVELEALPRATLRELFEEAFFEFYDVSIYEEVLEREEADRARIRELVSEL